MPYIDKYFRQQSENSCEKMFQKCRVLFETIKDVQTNSLKYFRYIIANRKKDEVDLNQVETYHCPQPSFILLLTVSTKRISRSSN